MTDSRKKAVYGSGDCPHCKRLTKWFIETYDIGGPAKVTCLQCSWWWHGNRSKEPFPPIAHLPVLYVTVGLPRSGKSTWAKAQDLPMVNPDSIRLAMHGKPFIKLAEPFVWAVAQTMVRSLFLSGHKAVILDATNVTEHRRQIWISSEWYNHYVVFNTPVEECVKRAGNNDTLVKVIQDMHRDWDFHPSQIVIYDDVEDLPKVKQSPFHGDINDLVKRVCQPDA